MPSLNLDVPRTLPVPHLSHSSISTYLGCPEKWRRRYLQMEYEPPNQKMIVGKVVGRSVAAGYISKIQTGEIDTELVSDTFDTEWRDAEGENVDWEGLEPGKVKDDAADSLLAYASELMPRVTPITVEESFEIRHPEAEWVTLGYMDWLDPSDIFDLKVSAKAKTQENLDYDAQATLYVAAKQIQGEGLKPFRWHAVKRPSPGGRSPATAQELVTTRTQVQVNNLLERIAEVAREIDWRVETGNWQGAAPGYWMCSQKSCGYWDTCRFGGQK